MVGTTLFLKLTMLLAISFPTALVSFQPQKSAQTRASEPATQDAGDLMVKIWEGVQTAQSTYTTGCGSIVETRTSKLLRVPLVFHGKFCASGMDKFFLEYFDPEPVRLVFNRDYLNVTTGKTSKTTEVIRIGDHVKKTQAYFSKENSIRNLRENFSITAKESPATYEMRFVPRSQRFKQKLNYLVVTLSKNNFLLRSLEIDGTSGVNSVFTIQTDALDIRLNEEMFKVYKQ